MTDQNTMCAQVRREQCSPLIHFISARSNIQWVYIAHHSVTLRRPIEDVEVRLLLLCTLAAILVASGEVGNDIALLELSVLRGGGAVCVCVDEVLGDHCKLCKDGAVPSRFASVHF